MHTKIHTHWHAFIQYIDLSLFRSDIEHPAAVKSAVGKHEQNVYCALFCETAVAPQHSEKHFYLSAKGTHAGAASMLYAVASRWPARLVLWIESFIIVLIT